MLEWLHTAYPWIKALHLMAVISWMAALLYMPRLFVYHTTAAPGSEMSETFKLMERRLGNGIMTPAMLASLLFGLGLLARPGYLAHAGGFIWAKGVLVAGLLFMHFYLLRCRADFAADRNTRSQRLFRIVNEVPTVLMIGIVILVVVKPF